MDPIEIVRAARQSVAETGTEMQLALALRALYGWVGEPETCLSNICHMLSSDHRRHLPATALPVIVQVTRLDYITPVLQQALFEVMVEQKRRSR